MSASSAASSPKLTFLGAAGTVTGSKYLLEHAGQQLLVDCGLFQGPKRWRVHNWDTPPFDVAGLDAIVLTHAHIDHTGYLPRLVALGYEGPIYATPETIALLELLLPDSGHLQEEEAEYANRRGYSKHHPALPLYTKKQAVASLRLLQPLPYHQERELLSGIRVRPADAGHIFGSAILELDLTGRSQRVRLVCSGDLGRYHQPLLRDPEPVAEADFLLLESTYGSRVHGQTAPTDALAEAVHAVQETGGALIVPAFAVGRTQQLLYYLRELVQAKRIPALPVYVDSPMATEATRVFRRLSGSFDAETQALQRDGTPALAYPNLHFVSSREESKALNLHPGPLVIIAASGMVTGGRVLHHLANRLPDKRNLVAFVGYQSEGTRGRLLLDGARSLKMLGQQVPVRARIVVIPGLSGHAGQDELLRWLRGFRQPPKVTYLVHGEEDSRLALAEKIRDTFGWRIEIPEYHQQVTLA